MVSKDFTTPATSNLHTDRDAAVGVQDGGGGRGALHVWNMNPSGGGGSSNPFAPPALTNKIVQTMTGQVQVVEYYNSATLLKTVTITYSDCKDFVAVVS